ncbi:MAG TPA: Ig-like domain-containing protein, partial [Nitriliruptorales bacterium]|nr:Ig-like domain-containing protein [Nitriliruptorales bacterium]
MGGAADQVSVTRARWLVLVGVAVLLAFLAGQAPAIEPPPEVDIVCVDRQDNVHHAVDASHCERGERSFDLPQDRPFHVCAEPNFGKLRYVTAPDQCSKRETPYTVPDNGPQFVCAANRRDGVVLPRGQLRRVTDAGVCDPRDETAFVTPAAPVAVDDAYTADEDLLLDVPDRGVLANDQDLTGGTLRATLVRSVDRGTLDFDSQGSFRFDPREVFDQLDEGQRQDVSFTYFTSDDALDSAPGTAIVSVVGRNDAPIALPDAHAVDEDTVLRVAAPGVLGNDTDAESHPLSAVLVTAPTRGRLALAADGSFAFDPAG